MGSDSTICWDLFSIYNFLKFWLKSTAFAENFKIFFNTTILSIFWQNEIYKEFCATSTYFLHKLK